MCITDVGGDRHGGVFDFDECYPDFRDWARQSPVFDLLERCGPREIEGRCRKRREVKPYPLHASGFPYMIHLHVPAPHQAMVQAHAGSIGAATIIQDMLLQSWSDPANNQSGPIRVFPACRRHEGMSSSMTCAPRGHLPRLSKTQQRKNPMGAIKNLAGEPCLVKPGIDGPIRIQGSRGQNSKSASSGIYQIQLCKAEEIRISPDE